MATSTIKNIIPVKIEQGGTGGTTPQTAKTALEIFKSNGGVSANDNPSALVYGVYSLAGTSFNTSYWPDENMYGTLIIFYTTYNRSALFIGHQHTYSAYMAGSGVLDKITWRRLDNA